MGSRRLLMIFDHIHVRYGLGTTLGALFLYNIIIGTDYMSAEQRPELPWNRPKTVLTYSRDSFRRYRSLPPLGMRARLGVGAGTVIFFGVAIAGIGSVCNSNQPHYNMGVELTGDYSIPSGQGFRARMRRADETVDSDTLNRSTVVEKRSSGEDLLFGKQQMRAKRVSGIFIEDRYLVLPHPLLHQGTWLMVRDIDTAIKGYLRLPLLQDGDLVKLFLTDGVTQVFIDLKRLQPRQFLATIHTLTVRPIIPELKVEPVTIPNR